VSTHSIKGGGNTNLNPLNFVLDSSR